jgi:hypothetical protein
MTFRVFHFAVLCFALLGVGAVSRGGMTSDTPYTERGKADFDTALQLLNPYGSWSKINDKWAFTPSDHLAPYTDGRWIYTEFGWYWKGRLPHSWLTEHYGYWKRGADKVWSWYPGPFWLPQIVEIRATTKYIGWRSAEVDDEGSFVEAPIDRYGKTDEWTFVTLSQFANPITPAIVAPAAVAQIQLEDSTDCRHTYLTYREIDRPGPHPADFMGLAQDGANGGLLPPGAQNPPTPVHPSAPPTPGNPAAAKAAGTTPPTLLGTQVDPAADTRQVKYWVTMSLPNFWATPPPDAKPDQIYFYRPDFYQDQDGIARRTTLWFNPKARNTLADVMAESSQTAKSSPGNGPAIPATPALPATDAGNPFHSPLDDSFHPASAPASTNASSKGSSKNPVPSGLSKDATAPLPATNATPVSR